MFLTAHATVGAAIAQTALPAWGVFVLAFLSHFAVDAIPHGDKHLGNALLPRDRVKKLLVIIGIDLSVLALLSFTVAQHATIDRPLVTLIAMFLAMAPDGLHGVAELLGWRRLAWIPKAQSWFHTHSHARLKHFDFSFPAGFALQLLFTVVVLVLGF